MSTDPDRDKMSIATPIRCFTPTVNRTNPIRSARHDFLPQLGIEGAEGNATLAQLGKLLGRNARTILRWEQEYGTYMFDPLVRYAVAGLLLELSHSRGSFIEVYQGQLAHHWLKGTVATS